MKLYVYLVLISLGLRLLRIKPVCCRHLYIDAYVTPVCVSRFKAYVRAMLRGKVVVCRYWFMFNRVVAL